MKIYCLRGAVGDKGLLEQHKEAIDKLLRCDYSSLNLEKLQGHDVYSMRLNDEERLLFTLEKIDGKNYLHLLDYLPTHDYHKSRFLRSGVLKRYRENHQEAIALCVAGPSSGSGSSSDERFHFIEIANPSFDMVPDFSDKADSIEFKVIDYYKGQNIEFNDSQNQVFSIQLPGLLSGAAGSGKSCVSISFLSSLVSQNKVGTELPIVYIAKSPRLVDELSQTFQELPLTDKQKSRVQFKTLESLLLDAGIQDFKDKAEFSTWYTSYKIKRRDLAKTHHEVLPPFRDEGTVYQEFLVASGASEAEYQDLADEQSLIPKVERAFFYEIYHAYTEYLSKNHFYDINFSPLPQSLYGSYAAVVADEAQDHSRHQLLQLEQLAENNQILYCVDTHQTLDGGRSTNNFLLHKIVPRQNHVVLNKSYRSALKPLQAANQIPPLKQRLSGGLSDKYEAKSLQPAGHQEQGMGYFKVVTKDELNNDWLQEQSSGPHCVIITRPEFLEEAQRLFPKSALILTPEMAKGLEYDVVIAYRLGDKALYRDMRQRLKEVHDKAQPQNAPKAGQANGRFDTELNGIYTAYTRTKRALIVCEPDARPNDELMQRIMPLSDSAPLSTWSLDNVSCDWEEQLLLQIQEGNDKTAQLIFSKILKRDEKDFDAYKRSQFPERYSTPQELTQTQSSNEELLKPISKAHSPAAPKLASNSSSKALNLKPTNSKPPKEPLKQAPKTPISSSQALNSKITKSKKPTPKAPSAMPSLAVKKQMPTPTKDDKTKSLNPTKDSSQQIQEIVDGLISNFDKSRLKTTLNIVTIIDPNFWSTHRAKKLVDYILKNYGAYQIFCSCYADPNEKLNDSGLNTSIAQVNASDSYLVVEDELKVLRSIRSFYKTYLSEDQSDSKVLPIDLIRSSISRTRIIYKPLLLFLKQKNFDLNQQDKDGKNLAFIAAENSCVEILRLLKELGADLNLQDKDGRTPAFIAAKIGAPHTLSRLIELGADLNQPDKNGKTPAFIAAEKDNHEILKLLHKFGADLDRPDNEGRTPTFIAALKDNLETFTLLCELDVDLNKPDKDGMTLPVFAADKNKIKVFRLLKKYGADLNKPDKDGRTPLFVAAERNYNSEFFHILKEVGTDLDNTDKDGRTPLFIASENNDYFKISLLQKLGANLNKPDIYGRTPVFIAAKMGNTSALNILIQLGADVNKPDNFGRTPAFVAAEKDYYYGICLLGKVADLNKPDNYSRTPAFIAAEKGHNATLRVLAEFHADLDKPDIYERTPVFIAAEMGNTNAFNTLIQLGANVNQPDIYGRTPAFIAAQMSNTNAFNTLIELGADVNKPDIYGRTPAFIAEKQGFHKIFNLLKGLSATEAADPASANSALSKLGFYANSSASKAEEESCIQESEHEAINSKLET